MKTSTNPPLDYFQVTYQYPGGEVTSATQASSMIRAWQTFQKDNPEVTVIKVQDAEGQSIHILPHATDRRVVIARYIGTHDTYFSYYPIWVFAPLGQLAKRCWELAQERGYGRGRLRFQIVSL